MLMEKDPFNRISYGIENKWCRMETKREREVSVELTTAPHAKLQVLSSHLDELGCSDKQIPLTSNFAIREPGP